MSVINQVLEDLDRRRVQQEDVQNIEALRYHSAGQAAATVSVTAQDSTPGSLRRRVVPVFVVLVLISVTALLYYYFNDPVRPVAQVTPVEPAPAVSVPVAAVTPVASTSSVSDPVAARHQDRQPQTTPLPQPVTSAQAHESSHKAPDTQVEHRAEQTVASSVATVQKQPRPLTARQKAETAYQLGYQQIRAHQYMQAIQSLQTALHHMPGHTQARELLAGLYIRQGRWVEASGILAEGVERQPTHLNFIKLYARSLMQLGRDEQALTLLERHRAQARGENQYLAMLAALYQRQSHHDQAARTYALLLKASPTQALWWVGLGISLEALGRHGEAAQAYQHASETGKLPADVVRFVQQRQRALADAQVQ